MLHAILTEAGLTAPSVGTFRAEVGLGAPLQPGMRLGTLLRAGRSVAVHAPPDVGGVATAVLAAGTWVEFGTPLMVPGEASGDGLIAPVARVAEADVPEGVEVVRADTDGTIYLRPEPGAPAFAAEGRAVSANATLGLVEVMKTFSPVRSPVAGTVRRVVVADGASVEAGAPLFWLDPQVG